MPPSPKVQADIDRLKAETLEHRALGTPFGVFRLHDYKAYAGRNPRTGAMVPVPAKTLPFLAIAPSFYLEVIGEDPSKGPKPPFLDLDDEPEEIVIPEPSAKLACAALYADVVGILKTKNKARYSGFGNFVKRKPYPRLEFQASQVWKQELNPQRG